MNDCSHCETDNRLHIAIVGTGSGAFAAAIKAVEEGARVTIIEGSEKIGGTCVNVGCVPSKIMIRGAHIVHQQSHHGIDGVALNVPVIDRKAMVLQQQGWVDKLRLAKYESILDNNPNITLIQGVARFENAQTLLVLQSNGPEISLQADRILLAVGASPSIPDIPGLINTPYWTSTEALVAETIPQHLLVLGGSVVALELAQAFRHLGSEVTVIARSRLLSKGDEKISQAMRDIFQGEGIKVMLNTTPSAIRYLDQQFRLEMINGEICGDQLLVATGRNANTSAMALDKAGVQTDARGAIIVDDYMRTTASNIFAAGDCSNQPQFVYVAAAAGTRAAVNMTGGTAVLELSAMPEVIFTHPQVATVGLTEMQAQSQGLNVESRTLSLQHVPRALANMNALSLNHGFITWVAEKNTGRIVGCQIVADEGGEIIQTAVMAMRNNMSIHDIASLLFPYLTMVEGLKLCAQTFRQDVTQLSCCAG